VLKKRIQFIRRRRRRARERKTSFNQGMVRKNATKKGENNQKTINFVDNRGEKGHPERKKSIIRSLLGGKKSERRGKGECFLRWRKKGAPLSPREEEGRKTLNASARIWRVGDYGLSKDRYSLRKDSREGGGSLSSEIKRWLRAGAGESKETCLDKHEAFYRSPRVLGKKRASVGELWRERAYI